MEQESIISSAQKEKTTKKIHLPQAFMVTMNAFSVVFAAEAGVLAVVAAIEMLIDGSFGILALSPFTLSLMAAAFGLIAMLTMKKITDSGLTKKAYGVASIVLVIQAILAAVATVAIIPFALFAAGAGYVQKYLWLNKFLPYLVTTAVIVGLLFVIKKIYDGMIKLLPNLTYAILGVAGVALILSIVATCVGFYGESSRYDDIYKAMDDINKMFQ